MHSDVIHCWLTRFCNSWDGLNIYWYVICWGYLLVLSQPGAHRMDLSINSFQFNIFAKCSKRCLFWNQLSELERLALRRFVRISSITPVTLQEINICPLKKGHLWVDDFPNFSRLVVICDRSLDGYVFTVTFPMLHQPCQMVGCFSLWGWMTLIPLAWCNCSMHLPGLVIFLLAKKTPLQFFGVRNKTGAT